jgi:CRISPR system Cascade subunit CasE
MFYTKLELNTRNRNVRRDLADVGQLHRTIYGGFNDVMNDKTPERILFRLEPKFGNGPDVIIVQSWTKPVWNNLLVLNDGFQSYAKLSVKESAFTLTASATYRFRLKAEAKKKGEIKNIINLVTEEEQMEWLRRKAQYYGFVINQALILDNRNPIEGKSRGNMLFFNAVLYEGILTVDDVEKVTNAVKNGIGHGKGFGLGLLSLARQTF